MIVGSVSLPSGYSKAHLNGDGACHGADPNKVVNGVLGDLQGQDSVCRSGRPGARQLLQATTFLSLEWNPRRPATVESPRRMSLVSTPRNPAKGSQHR